MARYILLDDLETRIKKQRDREKDSRGKSALKKDLNLCEELDKEYPQYGIAKHKGYGTKAHMQALREYGASPIHRKQFVRFLDKEKHE